MRNGEIHIYHLHPTSLETQTLIPLTPGSGQGFSCMPGAPVQKGPPETLQATPTILL